MTQHTHGKLRLGYSLLAPSLPPGRHSPSTGKHNPPSQPGARHRGLHLARKRNPTPPKYCDVETSRVPPGQGGDAAASWGDAEAGYEAGSDPAPPRAHTYTPRAHAKPTRTPPTKAPWRQRRQRRGGRTCPGGAGTDLGRRAAAAGRRRMSWLARRGFVRAFMRARCSSCLACSCRGLSSSSRPGTKALRPPQRGGGIRKK